MIGRSVCQRGVSEHPRQERGAEYVTRGVTCRALRGWPDVECRTLIPIIEQIEKRVDRFRTQMIEILKQSE